jgi:hypothetical protein
MKLISLLIALCFSLNVLASSGTIEAFDKAVNDYQYSLNVEWDQNDEAFLNLKTAQFGEEVKKLMENGLSQTEILSYLETKIQNKEALEAVKLKIALFNKSMSQEELLKTVKESTKDFYARGASWNGSTFFGTAIAALLIYGLVASIHFELTHECVRSELRYSCWDSGCYNQYTFCHTTCGYVDTCVEYKEK